MTKEFVLRGPKRKRRGPVRSRLVMESIVLVASNYCVSNIHYLSPCPHSYHYQGLEPSPRTQEVLKLIPHTTKDWLKTLVSNLSIIVGKSSRRRATTTWRRTSSSSSCSWRTWIKWRRRGTRRPRNNFYFERHEQHENIGPKTFCFLQKQRKWRNRGVYIFKKYILKRS